MTKLGWINFKPFFTIQSQEIKFSKLLLLNSKITLCPIYVLLWKLLTIFKIIYSFGVQKPLYFIAKYCFSVFGVNKSACVSKSLIVIETECVFFFAPRVSPVLQLHNLGKERGPGSSFVGVILGRYFASHWRAIYTRNPRGLLGALMA